MVFAIAGTTQNRPKVTQMTTDLAAFVNWPLSSNIAQSYWFHLSVKLYVCRVSLSRHLACLRSFSNSANPPSTVTISRPCAVVVSAHASPSERKPALRSVTVPRVCRLEDRRESDAHNPVQRRPEGLWLGFHVNRL